MNSKAHGTKAAAKPKPRKRSNSDKGSKRTDRCVAEFARAMRSRATARHAFVEASETSSFEKAETPTMQSKFAASERNQEQIKKLLLENAQLKCQVRDLEAKAEYHQQDLQKLYLDLESTKAELRSLKSKQTYAPYRPSDQIAACIDLLNNSLQGAPRIAEFVFNRIPSLAALSQKAVLPSSVRECLVQTLQVICDIAESEQTNRRSPRFSAHAERPSKCRGLSPSDSQRIYSLKQRIDHALASGWEQLSPQLSRNSSPQF